jgi:hypothetical protein
MILGQSVGAAANLCLDKNIQVQELGYLELQTALVKSGQVLSLDQ